MAASSWIIPVILFFFGIFIGYFLSVKRKYYLRDLENNVTYFQDIPPLNVLFLRKEGSSIRCAYIIDQSKKIDLYVDSEEKNSIINSTFCIKRVGNMYFITLLRNKINKDGEEMEYPTNFIK